jgi:hypothetical protein
VSSPPDPQLAPFGEIPDPLATAAAKPPALRIPELVPSPDRAVARKRRLLALLGSFAWLAVHFAVFGVRSDLGQLPPLYTVAQILLPFTVGALALIVALGSGRLGLGMSVGLVSALAILGPALFALIAVGAPLPSELPASATLVGILICFDITLAWAAVPLLFAALALGGAFPSAALWRSALVGAGAGLFAGAMMNLHCQNAAPFHMVLGHGLPVVLATLAGALLLTLRTRA